VRRAESTASIPQPIANEKHGEPCDHGLTATAKDEKVENKAEAEAEADGD
jgi:hypothetical protein